MLLCRMIKPYFYFQKSICFVVLCLTVTWLPARGVLAQDADSLSSDSGYHFSLSDCIAYSLEHQHNIKNAQLDKAYSHEQVGENRAKLFPHVNLNGAFVDNLKLTTTLIPDIFNGHPEQKIPVQFGNKYTSSVNGQVNQTVFNSNYFIGLKAAKIYEQLSVKALDRTRVETMVNVQKAYFNVLVNKEAIRIAQSNLAQLKKSFEDIKAQYNVGIAETVDVNRIESQYNNAVTGLKNQQRLLDYSLEVLKFQMGMPLDALLTLTESVNDFSPHLPVDTLSYRLANRPEYEMQQVQIALNKLSLKSTKLSFLPSLSFYLNYGFNYYSSSFSDLYKKGYDNSAIGLDLSFPIFSGTERTHQVNEAEITLEQSQNDMEHLEQQIRLEVKNAFVQYRNNQDQLTTQKENMALTQGVYDRIKYKYDQGVSSSLDLLSAENELQQAQSNYIDALLNVLMSRVDLMKAMGKIREQ